MKLQIRSTLTLFAALTIIAGAFAQSEKPMSAVDELLQTDIAWSKTTTTEEEDSYWLSDAKLLAPHQPLAEGAEAVIATFDKLRGLPGYGLAWQPTTAEVAESGDLGYTIGSYELKFDDPDGKPVVDQGKYLTVWRKNTDGVWRVAVDIFNTNLP